MVYGLWFRVQGSGFKAEPIIHANDTAAVAGGKLNVVCNEGACCELEVWGLGFGFWA